jgi:integrase
MARDSNRLSARFVASVKKPGNYADGLGLYLQVSDSLSKSWLFRYMRQRRDRWHGLGPVHTVSLSEAREAARQCRQMLRDGADPIEVRKAKRSQARAEAARSVTFKDCAERYIKTHSPTWKNAAHRAQWPATMQSYVYPVLGDLPVASIDTGLILKVLEPIWTEKPETAKRVRGRIEAVLDWARAREYRDKDAPNPARWKGHLDKLLPARGKVARVRHHPALPYVDIAAFTAALRREKGIAPRALEFTILTATRTSEVLKAKWSEIDLDLKLWTIPAERMKAGRDHRVPLSDRAVDILEALPREGDWIFPGAKEKQPLSNMSMLKVLKDMGRHDITVHGFRSTFRDWAAETTAYREHVAKAALAHVIPDKVDAAYRRGDLFEKRRRLMADWATYCAAKPRKGQVVPIRGSG